MTLTDRQQKAQHIKAVIDTVKPVTAWHMTSAVSLDDPPTVTVRDKKRRTTALLTVAEDGTINPEWMPGHSLTRNELRAGLGIY